MTSYGEIQEIEKNGFVPASLLMKRFLHFAKLEGMAGYLSMPKEEVAEFLRSKGIEIDPKREPVSQFYEYMDQKYGREINKKNLTVKLSDIAFNMLGITTQAAYFYLEGLAGYPNLGEGLSIRKNGSYHSWTMPVSDAEEFVSRVGNYRKEILN